MQMHTHPDPRCPAAANDILHQSDQRGAVPLLGHLQRYAQVVWPHEDAVHAGHRDQRVEVLIRGDTLDADDRVLVAVESLQKALRDFAGRTRAVQDPAQLAAFDRPVVHGAHQFPHFFHRLHIGRNNAVRPGIQRHRGLPRAGIGNPHHRRDAHRAELLAQGGGLRAVHRHMLSADENKVQRRSADQARHQRIADAGDVRAIDARAGVQLLSKLLAVHRGAPFVVGCPKRHSVAH